MKKNSRETFDEITYGSMVGFGGILVFYLIIIIIIIF